jgi:hypothetical protein
VPNGHRYPVGVWEAPQDADDGEDIAVTVGSVCKSRSSVRYS